MYLARLILNNSHLAVSWVSNPYRVHQRLLMAYDGDPRLLFRIDNIGETTQIIVQSHKEPNWDSFGETFRVLTQSPEYKLYDPRLIINCHYRFRLLANPTIKRDGKRLGLLNEADQCAWLDRKLTAAGATVKDCMSKPLGIQQSSKNPHKEAAIQSHFAVLYEGVLLVNDPIRLIQAIDNGIGSAKGFGFGLLSLARV